MVSKFNAFLLAGAFALPLVGTAALAQTSTGAQTSTDTHASTGAQVTTPPTATPHAGTAAKGDETASKTHRGKHKSTAAGQHHEKSGAAAGAGATVDPAKKL